MKLKRRGFLQTTLTAFFAVALDVLPALGVTKEEKEPEITPAEDDARTLRIVEIDYNNGTVEYNRRLNTSENTPISNLLRRDSGTKIVGDPFVFQRWTILQNKGVTRASFIALTKETNRYVYTRLVQVTDTLADFSIHQYPGLEAAFEVKNKELYA